MADESNQSNQPNAPKPALLLDNDLFFSVKVTDTLKHAGYATTTLRGAEAFARALSGEQQWTLALVNTAANRIDWRAAIVAASRAHIPVIAYGPHVDLQAADEARNLGATVAVSNSRLASDLPGIVARALRRQSESGPERESSP